ncbi:MAG: CAP domain-containing protein [Myxococcota bacterium]
MVDKTLLFMLTTAIGLPGLWAGCASSVGHRTPEWGEHPVAGPSPVPKGTTRDPALEEAAALLCARDGGEAVVDETLRAGGRVWEGQVAAAVQRGRHERLRDDLLARGAALVTETGATHAGLAEGIDADGEPCLALVVTRRSLRLLQELPAVLDEGQSFTLAAELHGKLDEAQVYLLAPDGSVDRREVKGHKIAQEIRATRGRGRYVVEVVQRGVDDAPEVSLLWPFTFGMSKSPPAPVVLFDDDGHSDTALARRLEALVHRLRMEQQLRALTLAPPLERVASGRARGIREAGRLGHRVPDRASAFEALRGSEPGFPVTELAEVQAQAATLEEAWGALLESPAHRYELVNPRASHLGVAVQRGTDGLGRKLVSVVALVARRILVRPAREVATELLGRLNLARDVVNHRPLRRDEALDRLAQELAEAMATAGTLDENLLGEPVTVKALEWRPGLADARVVVARVDDPLRLAPSGATLDGDAHVLGIGLVSPEVAGQWYVAVLVGSLP